MTYYIAYDMSDYEARTKIARLLENIGIRIQYSVFLCELDPCYMEEIFKQLSVFIDPECDSLHVYPVCKACLQGLKVLGKPLSFSEAAYQVL